MGKGISKRGVLIKTPAASPFEQAIFIVRDGNAGFLSAEKIVVEACRIADGCLKKKTSGRLSRGLFLAGMAGAGVMGALWLICSLVF